MPLLPQERPKQIALVVAIVALVALYGVYDRWYTPRVVEIEELQVRLSQLQDRNRQAQVTAARGGEDLEERLAIYERHVARLEELIPRSEEVPSLLNSMALEARQAGVELGSIGPEPSQPGEFYTRQSYEMAVIGDFHAVGRFLTAVASLPRIITPVDLDITPGASGFQRDDMVAPVTARFRIQTYVTGGSGPGELPAGLMDEVQG